MRGLIFTLGISLFSLATQAQQCGSQNGGVSCPLNMCCSSAGWCGTDSIHCKGAQSGYGSTSVVSPPSCDASKNSAGARKIGYYQSYAAQRSCNPMTPSQINTSGFTHLNFAFANISSSYQVVPAASGDVSLYSQFTALQSKGVQTWIAIGGGSFSLSGPTQDLWSQMAGSETNRQTFIKSLTAFLAKYNFQGVDLDWEFPVESDRGGQPGDTANFVTLVKEMKSAFGTKYGISVVLPPDQVELGYYNPNAMQGSVNWFNFMAYDLHGPWAGETIIQPQTNVTEIKQDLLPLWFDKVNPANVNFGLAYYGRGFTASSSSCVAVGCKFSGPSNPEECPNEYGIMSLKEIQQFIKASEGLGPPQLLQPADVKVLAFENQWIGYDDSDTFALKTSAASGLCMGGTMVWSVDLD